MGCKITIFSSFMQYKIEFIINNLFNLLFIKRFFNKSKVIAVKYHRLPNFVFLVFITNSANSDTISAIINTKLFNNR